MTLKELFIHTQFPFYYLRLPARAKNTSGPSKPIPNLMNHIALVFHSLILFFLVAALPTLAQVGINNTGAQPHSSAMLDVSGTTHGVLINRMTEAQRDAISAPAYGLMILNTDTDCMNMWTGAVWKQLCWDCPFSTSPSNGAPVCEGDPLQLSASSVSDGSFIWTGPDNFSSTLQNPVIPSASLSATGTYSVTVTRDGCTSLPRFTEVTIIPAPVISLSSNSPVCAGSDLVLTATPVSGASYLWTGPVEITYNGNELIASAIALEDAGEYSVQAVLQGCRSSVQLTQVAVGDIPEALSSITGMANICPSTSGVVYSIPPATGADTYSWSIPESASLVSDTGTSITLDYGAAPSGELSVSAENGCGVVYSTPLLITTNSICSPLTFNYTGSVQSFNIPEGVTQITIDAYGAQGANATHGGKGGRATGVRTVTPGELVRVYVGGFGSGSGGGWNGGESPSNGSGCNATTAGTGYGGGASDVRFGGAALSNRVIVAGGGGGRGLLSGSTVTLGGAGGGLTGGAGVTSNTAGGGGGGTQSAGGSAGTGGFGNGSAGTLGVGGNRCPGDWGGGDGGGGYYGGGGGGGSSGSHRGSGGGGSSFFGGVTLVNNTQGVHEGHGEVIITW